LAFNVHVPVAGSPDKYIVPNATVHVGWDVESITGAAGTTGTGRIIIFSDGPDVHPDSFVTV
jgi:hypothetical protein